MFSPTSASFRSEIEGLRAIAVLSVVLYHAKFQTAEGYLFQGGFLGVDVFFVISGYLITRILLSDLEAGQFSLAKFYIRRARRLLPALFLVLAVSIPFAEQTLDTTALEEFGASVLASLFFVSNIFFYFQDSYGAEPSLLKPFLHTWSLAIEEQFYLFFPLAIAWVFRRKLAGWGPIGPWLFGVAVLSFACAVYQSSRYVDAGFFLIFSRVWELLAGALIAACPVSINKARSWRLSYIMPSVGLVSICLAIATFDLSLPHPSWGTLVPVLGAVAVLVWGGQPARDPASIVLSLGVMRFFGLISYSLYLWHVPFMAFTRVEGHGYVTPLGMLGAIAASILMALLTWRFVERPFRRQSKMGDRVAAGTLISLGVIFSAYGISVVATQGWNPYRSISPKLTASTANWADADQAGAGCFDTSESLKPEGWCVLGKSDQTAPTVLLIGDSHAMALAPSVEAVLQGAGRWGYVITRSGCPLMPGFIPARGEPLASQCAELAQTVIDWLATQPIGDRPAVIISNRWNYYVCGDPVPNCGYTQDTQVNGIWARTEAARLEHLEKALTRYVDEARQMKLRVHFIAQVPHQPMDALDLYAAAIKADAQNLDAALAKISREQPAHWIFTQSATNSLRTAASTSTTVDMHDPADVLCVRGSVCIAGTAERSFYSDDDHVSIGAVPLLSSWIKGWLYYEY